MTKPWIRFWYNTFFYNWFNPVVGLGVMSVCEYEDDFSLTPVDQQGLQSLTQ